MKHNLRGPSGRFIRGCIYPNGCICRHHRRHYGRCTSECNCSCINKSLKPQKEPVSQSEKEMYIVALNIDECFTIKEAVKRLYPLWKDSWRIYRVTKKYRVIQESKIIEEKL